VAARQHRLPLGRAHLGATGPARKGRERERARKKTTRLFSLKKHCTLAIPTIQLCELWLSVVGCFRLRTALCKSLS
jgi:hypothetical protein